MSEPKAFIGLLLSKRILDFYSVYTCIYTITDLALPLLDK
jgi:hypothetical protein